MINHSRLDNSNTSFFIFKIYGARIWVGLSWMILFQELIGVTWCYSNGPWASLKDPRRLYSHLTFGGCDLKVGVIWSTFLLYANFMPYDFFTLSLQWVVAPLHGNLDFKSEYGMKKKVEAARLLLIRPWNLHNILSDAREGIWDIDATL